jgi:hypothetical protein
MNRKIILCAILAAVVIGAAGAQTSNTSAATAGNIKTDVDNFVSTRDFGSVEFDKAFLFGQVSPSIFDLGYARRFGSVYLGANFIGSLTNNSIRSADTTVITTNNSSGVPITTVSTQTTESVSGEDALTVTNNNLDVLIGLGLGFGNLGIKVGFSENLSTTVTPYRDINNGNITTNFNDVTEYANGDKTIASEYTDYSYLSGNMTPKVAVGTAISLGSLVIKPELTAAIGINPDKTSYSRITSQYTVNGYTTGGNSGEYERDYGYIRPNINLDVGVDFSPTFGVGLAYGIGFNVYNGDGQTQTSKYTYVSQDNATTHNASYTETKNVIERTDITNTITPSVSWSKDIGDRLKLGFGGKAAVSIRTRSTSPTFESTSTSQYQQKSGDVVTYDQSFVSQRVSGSTANPTETTNLDIIPQVNLGIQWQIIPNRFALNAGLGLNVFEFSRNQTITKPAGIQTRTDYNAAGGVTGVYQTGGSLSSYTDQENVTSTFYILQSASPSVGLVFSVTDKFTLDALTQFNISGAGGDLTNITSLLFTVKF